MLRFHVARTPLMLISNGLESRPALLAGDDLVSFSSSLLWMDEASLPLLLLLLLGSAMAHAGITQPYLIRMLCFVWRLTLRALRRPS